LTISATAKKLLPHEKRKREARQNDFLAAGAAFLFFTRECLRALCRCC
jgi:hypothetical protein